ncbi:MAG: hypothetical protein KDC56_02305, partial [Flavobacteriaceae bacterium]|nr:hypothetical protein [Flavobacteriaceae bacterium]
VLFGFFLFSIFIIEINIQQLNAVAEVFAPENVLERSANYRNEDVIEARKDIIEERAVNWYVIWYTRGLRYSLYLLLIYIFIFGDLRIKVYQPWRRLLAFSFLFLTVGNLLVGIPSGGRFLNFGLFLSLLVLLFYIDQFRKDTRTRLMTALVSPAFLLFIIVAVRNGLYSTSLMTVFGNPVLAMFNIGETSSINDFIK